MAEVCKHCGRHEEEHCVYEPKPVPDGCRCDPMTWDEIEPICDSFEGRRRECTRCSHERECHA